MGEEHQCYALDPDEGHGRPSIGIGSLDPRHAGEARDWGYPFCSLWWKSCHLEFTKASRGYGTGVEGGQSECE
jgi:hypothetical protein